MSRLLKISLSLMVALGLGAASYSTKASATSVTANSKGLKAVPFEGPQAEAIMRTKLLVRKYRGLSETEIKAMLGEPDSRTTEAQQLKLTYHKAADASGPLTLRFTNGRVAQVETAGVTQFSFPIR